MNELRCAWHLVPFSFLSDGPLNLQVTADAADADNPLPQETLPRSCRPAYAHGCMLLAPSAWCTRMLVLIKGLQVSLTSASVGAAEAAKKSGTRADQVTALGFRVKTLLGASPPRGPPPKKTEVQSAALPKFSAAAAATGFGQWLLFNTGTCTGRELSTTNRT